MVNSNLQSFPVAVHDIPAVAHKPAAAHTWYNYGQNHLTINTFDFSELFPLDFSNGLQTHCSLTIWTP
jgi:hypothetical protein